MADVTNIYDVVSDITSFWLADDGIERCIVSLAFWPKPHLQRITIFRSMIHPHKNLIKITFTTKTYAKENFKFVTDNLGRPMHWLNTGDPNQIKELLIEYTR